MYMYTNIYIYIQTIYIYGSSTWSFAPNISGVGKPREVVNMSSALLRGKTADAPKPGSKALAHGTGVIQEPWRNFIIIHTFIYTYNIDIHKYIYIYMSLVVHMQHVKVDMFLHDSWQEIWGVCKAIFLMPIRLVLLYRMSLHVATSLQHTRAPGMPELRGPEWFFGSEEGD